jgi:Arylsulfotransferase (ASST)
MIAGLLGPGAGPAAGGVSVSSAPSLFPGFRLHIHDYVVRCRDGPVNLEVHAHGGWRVAIGDHRFRRGNFRRVVPLSGGRAFRIVSRYRARAYRHHVRCLPDDFPTYSFTPYGQASPRFFSVDQGLNLPRDKRYTIIFDSHGVPVWWYHAPTLGPRVLRNGTVSQFDFRALKFQIRRLDGSLVRSLGNIGEGIINLHDLQRVGHGGYLVGSTVPQSHVDTSAYGGSSDATVRNVALQQVGPGGELLWDWRSQDHISLAETGRWWPFVTTLYNRGGYDILHWNSIEPDGGSVIASFRQLDAVYRLRKSTGDIVWKLGGTAAPESLEVKDDPRSHPLGGQHDARLLPDGTLTLFNNRTYLANHRPRVERFRINPKRETATLVRSITDPDVRSSHCCGSARRLPNRDWLIDWGGYRNNPIGGYTPKGKRTFLLRFESRSGYSYRAERVPATISARDLRDGMNAMYADAQMSQRAGFLSLGRLADWLIRVPKP